MFFFLQPKNDETNICQFYIISKIPDRIFSPESIIKFTPGSPD